MIALQTEFLSQPVSDVLNYSSFISPSTQNNLFMVLGMRHEYEGWVMVRIQTFTIPGSL